MTSKDVMPLIDISNPYADAIGTETSDLLKGYVETQRDADMAWLPAHDQQVAAKAVKEFAEKVIKCLQHDKSHSSREDIIELIREESL